MTEPKFVSDRDEWAIIFTSAALDGVRAHFRIVAESGDRSAIMIDRHGVLDLRVFGADIVPVSNDKPPPFVWINLSRVTETIAGEAKAKEAVDFAVRLAETNFNRASIKERVAAIEDEERRIRIALSNARIALASATESALTLGINSIRHVAENAWRETFETKEAKP